MKVAKIHSVVARIDEKIFTQMNFKNRQPATSQYIILRYCTDIFCRYISIIRVIYINGKIDVQTITFGFKKRRRLSKYMISISMNSNLDLLLSEDSILFSIISIQVNILSADVCKSNEERPRLIASWLPQQASILLPRALTLRPPYR